MATVPAIQVTGTVIPSSYAADVRAAITENPAYLAAAAGDTFHGSAAGVLARLAAGAQGALYRMGASVPNWLAKGAANQYLRTNAGATDIEWGGAPDISAAMQSFVEGGQYKAFTSLGGAISNYITVTHQMVLGGGFIADLTGSASITASEDGDAKHGMWKLVTGVTNPSVAGWEGRPLRPATDFTVEARVVLNSVSGQMVIIGCASAAGSDDTNMVAWRVNSTGTLQGVCDNGGTETTRDTSFTPDGSEMALRIEVRSGGTVVRFYRNNVQVGADVTTNIPTAARYLVCGIKGTGTSSTMYVSDLAAWQEI